MTKKINLPCNGNGGTKTIKKEADTITFETSGNCNFTSFDFTVSQTAFTNKTPSNGAGKRVSYSYDGTAIPADGYAFEYMTDSSPELGNGTGTIKND